MRGFQKGITLGGRNSGRALKVCGGGVGWGGIGLSGGQDRVIWWVVPLILVSLKSKSILYFEFNLT